MSLLLILIYENPVYAVFSFIFIALGSFLVLLFFQIEFFALLILIIYVGVITVLFLFVVIMYNLSTIKIGFKLNSSIFFYILLLFKAYWLTILLFGPVSYIFYNFQQNFGVVDMLLFESLYNFFSYSLFFCGFLLFLAMIGSIVITYSFYNFHR